MKQLIIAGNAREYQDYLAQTGLKPTEAKYLKEPNDLRGFHGVPVVRIGTFWLNPVDGDISLLQYESDLNSTTRPKGGHQMTSRTCPTERREP